MIAAETLLRLAGAAQLVLVVASPAIPVALRWRGDLAGVPVLLRRIF